MTLTDLQYQTMVEAFDYGRFGGGLFTQHLGTLQALRWRPRAPGNDTGAANGGKRRTRTTGKDFLDLLKRKDSTGKGRRMRRKRRQKRLVEFYDPAYASNPEEAVSRYLDRLKTEQAMAEEEEEEAAEEKEKNKRRLEEEETWEEESETWERQERVAGTAPRVVRPKYADAKILMPSNVALKDPSRPKETMLKKIMIPFLQGARGWLSGEKQSAFKQNKTAEVKVIGYNYTNLMRYYKMYYECLQVKKKYYEETVGEPMANIQDVMVQGGERVVLECHSW